MAATVISRCAVCAALSVGVALTSPGCKSSSKDDGDRAAEPAAPGGRSSPPSSKGPKQLRAPYRIHEVVLYTSRPGPQALEQVRAAARAASPAWHVLDAPPSSDEPPEEPSVVVTTSSVAELPPPPRSMLRNAGRGVGASELSWLYGEPGVVSVFFLHPSTPKHASVHASQVLVEAMARPLGAVILDNETRELFSASEWKRTRVDTWKDGLPLAEDQIVVHFYEDEDGKRLVTLGMQRFGLPELAVNRVNPAAAKRLVTALNLAAQALMEGASLSGWDLALDLATLKHPGLFGDDRPTDRFTLSWAPSKPREGDPMNVQMELVFSDESLDTRFQEQARLVNRFEAPGAVEQTEPEDRELAAASERARAELALLHDRFAKGSGPDGTLIVKAPFKTPGDGNEYMWVHVERWEGGTIRGVLMNEPRAARGVHKGSRVQVKQSDVFDYMATFPDGREAGGETDTILRKRMLAR